MHLKGKANPILSRGATKLLTNVKTCSDRIESMLQFQFVNVDRHIGPNKVLQSTAVVEVQVTNDDCLYILDTMSCLSNCLIKIMLSRFIVDLGKDVIDRCLRIVSVMFQMRYSGIGGARTPTTSVCNEMVSILSCE